MPEWIQTLTVDASHNAVTEVTGIAIIVQQRVGQKGRGPIKEEVAEAYANVARGAGELLAIFPGTRNRAAEGIHPNQSPF